MSRLTFVSSRDIPAGLAEQVARYAHSRDCGSFDGGRNKSVGPPPFEGSHAERDVIRASIQISGLCNATGMPLSALLATIATGDS